MNVETPSFPLTEPAIGGYRLGMENKTEMPPLFTRGGAQKVSNATDEKGRPVLHYEGNCFRCGGRGGSEAWAHTGWTCYECGGSGGHYLKIAKLYTADELAKLVARAERANEKRLAKIAAENAAKKAERDAERGDWLAANPETVALCAEASATEVQYLCEIAASAIEKLFCSDRMTEVLREGIERHKANVVKRELDRQSQPVGECKQRLEIDVVIEKIFEPRKADFYPFPTSTLVLMRAGANVLKWNASGVPSFDEGDAMRIKATVKDHAEYKGVCQTIVQRVVILG